MTYLVSYLVLFLAASYILMILHVLSIESKNSSLELLGIGHERLVIPTRNPPSRAYLCGDVARGATGCASDRLGRRNKGT